MASSNSTNASVERPATPPGNQTGHQQAVSSEHKDPSEISAEFKKYKLINVNLVPAQLSVENRRLKFHIDCIHGEGADQDPAEHMMFNILAAYLQPDTNLSVAEVAGRLDAMLPGNQPGASKDQDTMDTGVVVLMETFGDMIWALVKQIPHDHESQDKIVRLLDALDRLPFTQIFHGKHVWMSKFSNWEDTSRWAFGDTMPRQANTKDNVTDQQQCEAYINVHAFGARTAAIEWPRYQIIFNTLNSPLHVEEAMRISYTFDPSYMPAHVAAAAQWIIHGGTWLWDQIRWGRDQVVAESGTGYLVLGPQAWVTWMQAYKNLASEDANVIYWAGVLANKMEEIMVEHKRTVEEMENWDPEKQTVHGNFFREEPDLMQMYETEV